MRFKKKIDIEYLESVGYNIRSSELSNEYYAVKSNQQLVAQGILTTQVSLNTADGHHREGCVTIYWMPIDRSGQLVNSICFIPCDSNSQ